LITIPMLLFGIFGYLITEIDYSLEDSINCVRIALGMLGFFGFIVGLTRFIKPEKQETMAIALAAKVNKLKKNTGATVFFSPKEYASLQSRRRPIGDRLTPIHTSTEISTSPVDIFLASKPTVEIPHTPSAYPPKVRVCSKCGSFNPENSWNCTSCGETLSLNTIIDRDEASALLQNRLQEEAKLAEIEESFGSKSLPQISEVNAAANLAILNAVITLAVAIFQFIAGGEAIIAGVINAGTAIYYFIISSSIRKRDPLAYKAGLSAAKWGLLWVLGMFALYVNTSGGIDCIAAFIFGGWLITDGLLYLNLKNAESAFSS